MIDGHAAQELPGWVKVFENAYSRVDVHPQLEALRVSVGGTVVVAPIVAFHEYAMGQLGPIMKQPKGIM